MRKQLISEDRMHPPLSETGWMDLESMVDLEFTSEDGAHPVEAALLLSRNEGWRAANPGKQTIRLTFHTPQNLRRLRLEFVETSESRTQEFVMRWSQDRGQTKRDVVRQQWNFNPDSSTREVEDLRVELNGATWLELEIVPNISGGSYASLLSWRIAG